MYNFIHVPKNAGSSFFNIILKHTDKLLYSGHTRLIDIQSFAFIKHPYDRLLSAYFYLINGGGQNELDISYQELLKPYKDFKDFVLHIASDDLMNKILHIKPMSYWLCDEAGNLIVNRIFKIENIGAIDSFLSELGIEEKLSNTFINVTHHDHYTDYLDIEVIAEINNLYALDFELFGYKKL
jgi:hypothetical protein